MDKMDYSTPLVHLARGLTDSTAIESLISLGRLDVNLALSVNRNLSEQQISTLLGKFNTLQRVQYSPETELGILLASRYDLTTEQMWRIVKGKSILARQALLSRLPSGAHSKKEIDNELFEYILRAPWYTEDYGQEMRHSAFNFDSTKLWRLPNHETNLYNSFRRMPNSVNPSEPVNRAYAERESKIWRAREQSKHDLYRKEIPHQEHLSVRVDSLTESRVRYLNSALETSSVHPEVFTRKIQRIIGKEDSNFYKLFFDMLPGWDGTLPELIAVTKTLTSSSKATTLHPIPG